MVQTIRPASDISSGGWTDEGSSFNDGNLYTSLQETSHDDDTSYVLGDSSDTTFEVKLGSATDPVSSSNHTIKAWGKGFGSGAGEKVDVYLYQGVTQIAQLANNWTPGRSAYAEGSWTLSGAEADNISDYSDLRVRITVDTLGGGETFRVTQIYMEVPDAAGNLTQTNYRFKNGDTVALNSDTDWAAAINVNPSTQDSETVLRLRIAMGSDGAFTGALRLEYKWSGDGTFRELSTPGTPPIAAVTPVGFHDSSQYADGAATTDVLSGDAGAFVAGSGEEGNDTVSVTLAAGEHTEFEFCFVVRKLFGADDDTGAYGFITDGDTVEFRLTQADGTVLNTYTNTPILTVNHAVGLIAGVFGETVGETGPWRDDNGNLYVYVEHAELPAPVRPCLLKSTDGGDTWVPQDDAGRTGSNDELEAADGIHISADDVIYLGWVDNNDPNYQEFQTSAHGSPDVFATSRVEVEDVGNPTEQATAIVRRTDNTTIMFYNEEVTVGKLFYKIRSSGGTWGSELTLEDEGSINWTGVQAVLGASDKTHIIYSNKNNTGEIYYRSIASDNTLSSRESVLTGTDTDPDHSPLVKPVYWDDGGTEKIYLIYYKPSDGKLYSRIVSGGTLGSEVGPITDNAVISDRATSGQPTAQVVVDGTDVYVVYSHASDLDLYLTKSANGGAFDTDTEILDAVSAGLLSANIFTHNSGNGSAKVVGIMYDDERFGEGNTGGTVYFEHDISSGTAFTQTIAGALTFAGAIIKKAEKKEAGALTYAGAHARLTKKIEAGALTFAGALATIKIQFNAIAGALTFAGAHSFVRLYFQTVTGALTFAGALSTIKIQFNAVAGAMTFAGARTAKTLKALAGALTFAGSRIAKTLRSSAGSITFAGAHAFTIIFFNAIAGALTFAGARTAKTLKVSAGVLTFAGARIAKTLKAFAGALTFAGALSSTRLFFQTVSGALTFVGSRTAKTFKSYAGALTFVGGLTKKTLKALSGALTFAGALATNFIAGSGTTFNNAIAGAMTFAGSVSKKTSVSYTGALMFVGALVKKTKKVYAGVIEFIGSLIIGHQTTGDRINVNITLRSRSVADTLSANNVSFVLHGRDRLSILDANTISYSLPERGVTQTLPPL